MGDQTFFGPGSGFVVDTTQKVTVVTQFITVDGTDTGDLSDIVRIYVQNGKVIQNSATSFTGISDYNSITDQFCIDQKNLFGDTQQFIPHGGLKAMGDAMSRGLVLVMSIWDDYAANMLWLDSNDPSTGSASTPGVARGSCSTSSGVPSQVESTYASNSVTFSNIKVGTIGSTTATGSSSSSSSANSGSATTSANSNSGATSSANSGNTPSSTSSNAQGSTTSSSSSNSGSGTCNIGAITCKCTTGGACNSGLTCVSGVCVDISDLKGDASIQQISVIMTIFFLVVVLLL
jgi:cellulose 1,4-beta-cellobiosidase